MRSDPEVQLYNSVPHQTRDDTFRFIAEQREKYVRESQVIWHLRCALLRASSAQ